MPSDGHSGQKVSAPNIAHDSTKFNEIVDNKILKHRVIELTNHDKSKKATRKNISTRCLIIYHLVNLCYAFFLFFRDRVTGATAHVAIL